MATLHGDMTQSMRLSALKAFKDEKTKYLIASDVAARGLDIPSVSHVFNYDVPSNAEDYVHRIGRTGRAGRTGQAFTFISDSDDEKLLLAIEQLISISIPIHTATSNNTNLNDKNNSQSRGSRNKSISKKAGEHEKTVVNDPQKPIKTRRGSEKRPPDWIGGNGFCDLESAPDFLL